MIKNERQYRITKAQAEKFDDVLAQFDTVEPDPQTHPLLIKAQKDALRSQLDDLYTELAEYEALRSGKRKVLEVESFDELPRALIQARIAAGLSQKELAERLGLKEQQIQQYESTEYASASFSRMLEVINALGIQVREDVFLPNAQVTKNRLFQRLRDIGVEREFLLKGLLPPSLSVRLETETDGNVSSNLALKAAAAIGRVFKLKPIDIFGVAPLQLNNAAFASARFKMPAKADERKVSAYTFYAHYLAMLVLEATPDLQVKPVPTDPHIVHDAIVTTYGAMTFENALRYVWSLGIPVLPLKVSGGFHGACWRINWRNVIVLKQRTDYVARWLFDLIHELAHAGSRPDEQEFGIIETEDSPEDRSGDEEEQEADEFAEDVIFNGRADELAEMCARRARRDTRRLKGIVPQVAREAKVPISSLAYHMAFRLSLDGDNGWWPTATNLQDTGIEPWQITRNMLLQQMDLKQINEIDRNLLLQALSDVKV